MKIIQTKKKISKTLILVGFLCLLFVTGRPLPYDTSQTKRIKSFDLKTYKYGLYLNQAPSTVFYNFSPYDSYYLDSEGKKNQFAFWDQEVFSKEFIASNRALYSRITSLLSSFNLINPSATFVQDHGRTKIKSKVTDNQILVYLAKHPNNNNAEINVLTMSFNDNDFIFDKNFNLLTPVDDASIERFESFYEKPINQLECNLEATNVTICIRITIVENETENEGNLQNETAQTTPEPQKILITEENIQLDLSEIIIFNQESPGAIKIFQSDNENGVILNMKNNQIEFHTTTQQNADATVTIYDNIQEII